MGGLVDLVKIVGVLAAVKYFILDSINLQTTIEGPAMVTAIICATIAFTMVIIGMMLNKK